MYVCNSRLCTHTTKKHGIVIREELKEIDQEIRSTCNMQPLTTVLERVNSEIGHEFLNVSVRNFFLKTTVGGRPTAM